MDKESPALERSAAGIALATLALVTSVAVFTAWDRAHTATLEDVTTPTAVGDMHFVQEPAARTGSIGLKYEGRNLDMVSESKLRDAKLIQAGADDSGVYSLYQPEDKAEALPKDRFFMKVGMNEFIEVTKE